ncbi:hypothetical protein BDV96DRAFT_606497 [Lophiotrema nucula]|uniref:SMODS and SLOG-associating 2TM effector domain-containing protein n=1 Tax=Lophiotrema nucula TaxID=690887 RepID=A0A6A5YK01_9PLEO|nr:hypothetical protein BDV96DRAFT_606497 [Lophiotrema nucula]
MDFLPNAFRPGRDRIRSVEDGMSGSTLQQPNLQAPPRRQTVIAMDDKLSIFRHMIGIHSTQSLAATSDRPDLTHNNLHFDGRAAPNLGIYNRVVHREQEAKRGYKYSSLFINGCLGLQVVVAAALTAMGAANSNHRAITAFGAINTVIAGILTYLKGSGLPNRIRYYENEWKKIREFIEQRERDFSRPDCTLDVYEVVRVIEHMYEEVKADVQTNTPDSYVSVGDIRARVNATNPQVPKLHELGTAGRKFQDLEMKYGHKLTDFLESIAHKEEERLRSLERGVGKEVEAGKSRFVDAEKDLEKELEARRSRLADVGRDFEKQAEARRSKFADVGRVLEKEAEARRSRFADAGRELEKEAESGISRVTDLGRDVQSEADRHRSNLARIGKAMDDEIHAIGPKTKEER